MHDDEVIQYIEDVINNGHGILNDREKKLNKIEKIESKLESDFWKSADVNSGIQGLYNNLNEVNREILFDGKKEAKTLMQKEKRQRSSLRKNIKGQLPSNAVGLIHSTPVDELLTRIDRKQNKQTRNQLKQLLLADLKQIRSNVRNSTFNISKSTTILSGNDRAAIKEYVAEFVWHLQQRGWRQKDIEEIPEDLRDINDSPSSYLSDCAIREEHRYTGIVFIPGLNIGVSPRTLLASKTTLYPAGELSANVVPHLSSVGNKFATDLTYYLHHCGAVGFEVTAFTKDHADSKIIDRITAFIGELSHFRPKRSLTLPQFYGTLRRFVWRNNSRSIRLKTQFTHNIYSLNERIFESLAKFHEASYGLDTLPLVERLSNATRFFHRANSPGPQTDEVVNSIITIEAAVSRGYSKQNEIIGAAMEIAGVYPNRRDRVRRSYELLYQVRNEIVHSGSAGSVSTAEIDSALNTVRYQLRVLIQSISHYIAENGITTLNELERYVKYDRTDQFVNNAIQLYEDGISVETPHRFEGEILNESEISVFEVKGVLYIEPNYPSMQFYVTLRDIQFVGEPVQSDEELKLRTTIAGNDVKIDHMNPASLLTGIPVEYVRDGYAT